MPQNLAIPAENTKNTPKSKQTPFSALPYYKAALAILSKNLRLITWKIAGDILARATFFLIAAIVLITLGAAFFTTPDVLQSPAFITGLIGTTAVLWLLSLTFNTFTHSGIYASINHLLNNPQSSDRPSDASPDTPTPSFFSSALERFDAVLGLQIISLATRTLLVFLAATLFITLFSTFPLNAPEPTSTFTTSTVWASGIALYMVFTLLVRLTIELIAAPLFLEQRSLPDAILHAAHFVLEYPIQLYRLFVSMLAITLIPMGVYFLLLMTQNAILMFAPPLAPIGLVIRIFADLFLFISLAAVAVVFYTAVFAFYGERRSIWTTSYLEDFMHNPENSTPKFLRALFNQPQKTKSNAQSDFSEDATLTTLTPSDNPNIVTFDQIFEPDVLTHFTAKPTENDEVDEDEPASENTAQHPEKDLSDDDPNPNPSE